MAYDPTGVLVAMGCGDGTIKVYDAEKHFFTHHFQKHHTGRIEFIRFHPRKNCLYVFSSALDAFRIWDLRHSKCIAVIQHHGTPVTDVAFSDDGQWMVTTARDNVMNVYRFDCNTGKVKHVKKIPVFESIEAAVFVPIDRQHLFMRSVAKSKDNIGDLSQQRMVFTAGEQGVLKVWDVQSGELLHVQEKDQVANSFTQLQLCKQQKQLLCVTEDGNFLFYDIDSLRRSKQIMGFNDEILDIKYVGRTQQKIVVATNSPNIVLFDLESKNAEFLVGHTDIVLSLDVSRDGALLVSGSKDQTVRVWDLLTKKCVAVAASHTAPVTALCFAPKSADFFVSCSEDRTIKIWNVQPIREHLKSKKSDPEYKNPDYQPSETDLIPIPCERTALSHQKEVSDVTISPDEKLIATASADKTAKIWNREDLQQVMSFQHPMGVWSVSFSSIDRAIATASQDNLVRIWSLKSGQCLKKFEGHTNPVLKVAFINLGTQLISADASGLIKLWIIRTNECVETFDEHSERAWGLAIRNDGRELVTGAEDSRINVWRDNTQEMVQEERRELDDTILKDQRLQNLLRDKKYLEAIVLAISLDHPRDTFRLFEQMMQSDCSEEDLHTIIRQLNYEQITYLLQYIIDWNTNSRFSSVAQHVLHAMFVCLQPNFISWSYEKSVDSLLAYSRRHFQRIQNLMQQSNLLDFTISNMQMLKPVKSEQESQTLSAAAAASTMTGPDADDEEELAQILEEQQRQQELRVTSTIKQTIADPELQHVDNESYSSLDKQILASVRERMSSHTNDGIQDSVMSPPRKTVPLQKQSELLLLESPAVAIRRRPTVSRSSTVLDESSDSDSSDDSNDLNDWEAMKMMSATTGEDGGLEPEFGDYMDDNDSDNEDIGENDEDEVEGMEEEDNVPRQQPPSAPLSKSGEEKRGNRKRGRGGQRKQQDNHHHQQQQHHKRNKRTKSRK